MTVLDRVKEIAGQKNITLAELERVTGLSNGAISKWGKSLPNTALIAKVADYLNVSVDYLLDREDPLRHYRVDIDGLNNEEIEIIRTQLRFAEELAREQIRQRKGKG